MLSVNEINGKYAELLKQKEKLAAVKKVVFEGCKDMSIWINKEDISMMEQLIEQSGQFVVLKKNYIATWQNFAAMLKAAGYSDETVKCMLQGMEYGNLKL